MSDIARTSLDYQANEIKPPFGKSHSDEVLEKKTIPNIEVQRASVRPTMSNPIIRNFQK